jgi:hypothetical protein
MVNPVVTAERIAIGLLIVVAVAVVLVYFAADTGWIWRQFM